MFFYDDGCFVVRVYEFDVSLGVVFDEFDVLFNCVLVRDEEYFLIALSDFFDI